MEQQNQQSFTYQSDITLVDINQSDINQIVGSTIGDHFSSEPKQAAKTNPTGSNHWQTGAWQTFEYPNLFRKKQSKSKNMLRCVNEIVGLTTGDHIGWNHRQTRAGQAKSQSKSNNMVC